MSAPKADACLLNELRGLIEQPRQHVAQTANSTVTTLSWHVGLRIHCELLKNERAEHGEQIVSTLSRQLVTGRLGALPPESGPDGEEE